MAPKLSFDPKSGLLTRGGLPKNTTETVGVADDSGIAATTPWGTNHTGRGTEVTSPLNRLHDMTPMERKKSIQRSRFIANRLGLGRALVEGSTRYAIGSGVSGYAATGDQQYDDACNAFCDEIMENADALDVRGELDFYEMQEVVCPSMMTDGDCGAAKILERDRGGRIIGTPRLQLFTTEQIGSGLAGDYGDFVEGIKRDEFGRMQKVRVLQAALPGRPNLPGHPRADFREYDARDFMLVLDPKRIGISRGIPWTHHAQASAITMMDLKVLEESAAYLNAFFGAVITTPTGEMPEGFEDQIFRRRSSTTDENAEGADPSTTKTENYRKYMTLLNGALIPVLKEGEKLQMVASERPSLTFAGFMDWLVNDIAWGYGIPPSWVWAIAGQKGPETRQVLNQADVFFQFIMRRMVSRFCKPTRDFIIRFGLTTGQLNDGRPPANGKSPFLARWHGPRKITIDEGREGRLEMERISKGLGTEQEFHARRGQDGDTVALERIRELRRRLDWCEENGVPPELYFGPQPGQNIGGTGGAAAPVAVPSSTQGAN